MIVIHYSEIGLKGRNRAFFERKLVDNVGEALKGLELEFIQRQHQRVVISGGTEKRREEFARRLRLVPGISYFFFASRCDLDIEKMKEELLKLSESSPPQLFAVDTKRSNKKFPLTSVEVNRALGEVLTQRGWPVDLVNPEITFSVEIAERETYLYSERIQGLGGLPVGTAGRLVALVSGGIDSPVAAHRMMRRGSPITYIHFFNFTQVTNIVKDKVKRVVSILQRCQPPSELYMVPFEEIQRAIIAVIPGRYRMIVYRRVMFEIANLIAERVGALGLVTGDSLGQVASQTLENLNVIYHKAKCPVIAPLIGYDKQEIVDMAKRIGTYETSILPYSDCCSLFVDKHPETRADVAAMEVIEGELRIEEQIQKATESAEVISV
jgi:thiamine biosynthesis protein ThiI